MNNPASIVFIHSLNNYTGSPNVLAMVVRHYLQRGSRVQLHTSRGEGFLSDIPGVEYRYTCYRWCRSGAFTALLLLCSQLQLFFRLLCSSRKSLYYINSIIPFGAILACKLSRKRYVIHVHEDMQQSKALYKLLRRIYARCNRKTIFVSHYLAERAVSCRDGVVIYNALPDAYFRTAQASLAQRTLLPDTILMVSSLRKFKGIYEFVALAKRLPHYPFVLVLSASEAEVSAFAHEVGEVPNLTLHAMQRNLHPFYGQAKLLLQLSHPDEWVETFGLTILEAMAYGVPAIVPNVGGPTELVANGVNGYTVNPYDLQTLENKISEIMQRNELYMHLSVNAKQLSEAYTELNMFTQIENYL